MTTQDRFYDAVRKLRASGQRRISAQCLAQVMWPDARHDNSNGAVFNQCSGVAGRLLRRFRACSKNKQGTWDIIDEFLEHAGEPTRDRNRTNRVRKS